MIVFPHGFLTTQAEAPSEAFENTYSVEFDGSNDYVDLGSTVGVYDAGDAFSVSFWFYFTDAAPLTIHRAIIGRSSTTVGWVARLHDAHGGAVRLSFALTQGALAYKAQASSALTANTWYHAVCTYGGASPVTTGSINVYINGSVDNDVTDSNGTVSSFAYSTNTKIGSIDSAWFFEGKIDEVGVWDVALDSDAVTALYNSGSPISLSSDSGDYDNSSNLEGWWRMGDGANYPIVKNQKYFSQTALDFDGSNDAVVITDSGVVPAAFQGLGNNNDYSVSAWIKTNASTGGGSGYWFPEDTIVEIRNESSSATHCPFSFGVTANKLWLGRTENHITGSENVASVSTVNDGNWHHVAFTIDDDAWVLYIDGSSNASGTFSTATGDCSVATTTSNFVIGARTTNTGGISSPFDGEIDDVSIYNTTLSSSDITDIYNSGYPKDESERSGLVGYWKMGDGDTYPTLTDNSTNSNDGTMTNMASDDFVAAKGAGTMTNMASDDIVEDTP